MARNEEKAQSMLYRFRKAMQSQSSKGSSEGWLPLSSGSTNDPLVPSLCTSLSTALHNRKELLKEISRKISKIQDQSLDDSSIQSLNDEINRLIRKRTEWDTRARELGHVERDKAIKWGDEHLPEPGNVHGYFYFGRAKELPGVKELLNPKREGPTKLPPRIKIMKELADSEYFGIYPPEEEQQQIFIEKQLEEKLRNSEQPLLDWCTGLPVLLPPMDQLPEPEKIQVPSQSEIELMLVEEKKRELLSKYGGGV